MHDVSYFYLRTLPYGHEDGKSKQQSRKEGAVTQYHSRPGVNHLVRADDGSEAVERNAHNIEKEVSTWIRLSL